MVTIDRLSFIHDLSNKNSNLQRRRGGGRGGGGRGGGGTRKVTSGKLFIFIRSPFKQNRVKQITLKTLRYHAYW